MLTKADWLITEASDSLSFKNVPHTHRYTLPGCSLVPVKVVMRLGSEEAADLALSR